jgi:phage host-nuclease inhibitor protein Gam
MKNKTRIKVTLPNISSREEAEAEIGEIIFLTTEQLKLTAEMDAELAEVRKQYESILGTLARQSNEKKKALCAWALANLDQFPKGRKSLEFTQGTIGFRTGTPKLALLSRAWTWEKVLTFLTSKLRFGEFVRVKKEVDKDAILGAVSAKEFDEADLKFCGMKVVQDESFFVEPKLTEEETRQTAEVA